MPSKRVQLRSASVQSDLTAWTCTMSSSLVSQQLLSREAPSANSWRFGKMTWTATSLRSLEIPSLPVRHRTLSATLSCLTTPAAIRSFVLDEKQSRCMCQLNILQTVSPLQASQSAGSTQQPAQAGDQSTCLVWERNLSRKWVWCENAFQCTLSTLWRHLHHQHGCGPQGPPSLFTVTQLILVDTQCLGTF